jgi:hypothetical protein
VQQSYLPDASAAEPFAYLASGTYPTSCASDKVTIHDRATEEAAPCVDRDSFA